MVKINKETGELAFTPFQLASLLIALLTLILLSLGFFFSIKADITDVKVQIATLSANLANRDKEFIGLKSDLVDLTRECANLQKTVTVHIAEGRK